MKYKVQSYLLQCTISYNCSENNNGQIVAVRRLKWLASRLTHMYGYNYNQTFNSYNPAAAHPHPGYEDREAWPVRSPPNYALQAPYQYHEHERPRGAAGVPPISVPTGSSACAINCWSVFHSLWSLDFDVNLCYFAGRALSQRSNVSTRFALGFDWYFDCSLVTVVCMKEAFPA